MKKIPLYYNEDTILINPDVEKRQLSDAIFERLEQLDGMLHMLNLSGSNDHGELADHIVGNSRWLLYRTINETKNLLQFYIRKFG